MPHSRTESDRAWNTAVNGTSLKEGLDVGHQPGLTERRSLHLFEVEKRVSVGPTPVIMTTAPRAPVRA
jgi:hypothetical protein